MRISAVHTKCPHRLVEELQAKVYASYLRGCLGSRTRVFVDARCACTTKRRQALVSSVCFVLRLSSSNLLCGGAIKLNMRTIVKHFVGMSSAERYIRYGDKF
jgi:cytochrome c biogenesis protein CcdA